MKIRGTRGGILLTLEQSDTVEEIEKRVKDNSELLSTKISLQVDQKIEWPIVEKLISCIKDQGGVLKELKPAMAAPIIKGESVILERTIRSGSIIESNGNIVILGDVNAGAELVAADDIIVVGALRGLAHAGANGNEGATIWAKPILSPQLRIANAVAQADAEVGEVGDAEVAFLSNGQIAIKPWK